MNSFSHVPPGFRFHPTDEELVDYYLRKKIASKEIDLDVIKEVDLYKIEPWDLLELCKIGEEQSDWYFFSHKDKKYPTGTRTNRATKAGFWKATGRDKAIYSKLNLIGMRKTLVFYKGRAPNGQKSDWIMHEYRLETNENATPQEEGWVVCRAFRKKLPCMRNEGSPQESLCWYEDQSSYMQDFESPRHIPQQYPNNSYNNNLNYSCKQELDQLQYNNNNNMPPHHDPFLQLPHLESPKIPTNNNTSYNFLIPYGASGGGYDKNDNMMMLQSDIIGHDAYMQQQQQPSINDVSYDYNNCGDDEGGEQVRDWRVLDKFVASQFSHGDSSSRDSNAASLQVEEPMNISSISTASSQMDLWK